MRRDPAVEIPDAQTRVAPPGPLSGGAAPPRLSRWLAGILVVTAVATVYFLGRPYLNRAYLLTHLDGLRSWVGQNQFLAVVAFVAIYAGITTLSLPSCTLLTLLSGALFGLYLGTAVASVASALGATGAFLTTRYLFRAFVERHGGRRLALVQEGVTRDGAWYLLTIRLVPLFPYFLVNAAMGLTRMRVATFWWVSQLGMVPILIVYVNAGTELSRIKSTADILTWRVVVSLALLALVPLALRRLVRHIRPAHP